MVLEGVRPPTDGKIPACLQPLSVISLQASKSHSSKAPTSESFPHATPSGHSSTTLVHTETASSITPELQTTSTQHEQSSHQADRLGIFLRVYICVLPDLKRFSTPPTIKSKCVSRPLRHS